MAPKLMIFLAIVVALVAVAASFHQYFVPANLDVRPAKASSHPDETMAAIVYYEHGDASTLSYETSYPKPLLDDSRPQYLIHVKASALNPVDFKLRRNPQIPQFLVPLPKIPGADIAGVVVQASPSAGGKFQPGDRVAAMLPLMGSRWGAHADYVVVEEGLLAAIGDSTSFETAAAAPLAALTALQSFQKLPKDGTEKKKLLVHAGAGGVGTFAIQLGKILGMHVATTASAPKANLLQEIGADMVIDYRTQRFEDTVSSENDRYDVVLDPMSWLYEERSFHDSVLKPTGHYLNIPSSDWGLVDGKEQGNGMRTAINFVKSKLWNMVRPGSIATYGLKVVQPDGKDLQEILDLMDAGKMRAVVDRTFHLSEAVQAYQYLEEGHATGKVVLQHGTQSEPIDELEETGENLANPEQGEVTSGDENDIPDNEMSS